MSKRKPKPKPRPTKALVQRRIEELLRIILDGAEGWDLCEYVREQEQTEGTIWHRAEGEKPLSYSQIRRYAARAEKMIFESSRAQRQKLLRRHLAQRRNLYAKAVSQGDIRAALACLDSEAKLKGLFEHELNRIIAQMQRDIEDLKAKQWQQQHSEAG